MQLFNTPGPSPWTYRKNVNVLKKKHWEDHVQLTVSIAEDELHLLLDTKKVEHLMKKMFESPKLPDNLLQCGVDDIHINFLAGNIYDNYNVNISLWQFAIWMREKPLLMNVYVEASI